MLMLSTMAIWLSCTILGGIGGSLVLYATIASFTGKQWEPVEAAAPFLSSLLTLVGAILVAASVYLFSPNPRPPWKVHRTFTSPGIILCSTIAIWFLFRHGVLPQTLVSGFALIAIAGGVLRSLPYPVER